MTVGGGGRNGAKSRTMAAVMVAVRAYLEQEGGSSGPTAPQGLSDWKTALRQPIRRRAGEPRSSWKSQR